MGNKDKKKKRSRSSSSSSSSSSDDERRLKKLKKKLKKEQRRSEKLLKKKIKAERKRLTSKSRTTSEEGGGCDAEPAADIPVELMERSKAMAPMTKEEWDKRQSVVRRVYDEDSGRYRLIKGDGEVIEEIVSRDRHRQINQQANQADGAFFQAHTVEKKTF